MATSMVPLGLLAAPASSVFAGAAAVVVPPTESVAGKSQAGWSASWWTWAWSFRSEASPITDRTGARCAAGQSGPVWFLAGAFGSALVERTCTVPRGVYLFFPLVNIVFYPPDDDTLTCDDVTESARRRTDSPIVLVAEVDGRKIPDLPLHRQATTKCFNLAERAEGRAAVYPSAANGYYLMLAPLSPGHHSLRFGGHVGSLRQAISYELDVE